MKRFKQWLDEQVNDQTTQSDGNVGPAGRWNQLIDDHRIKFTAKFAQSQLTNSDIALVVAIFDHYKYVKQKPVGNIFTFKYKGVVFEIGFFNNQKWACSITNSNHREVTELFQVTETKINGLIELFDKAIDAQTFKDLLPVKVK